MSEISVERVISLGPSPEDLRAFRPLHPEWMTRAEVIHLCLKLIDALNDDRLVGADDIADHLSRCGFPAAPPIRQPVPGVYESTAPFPGKGPLP